MGTVSFTPSTSLLFIFALGVGMLLQDVHGEKCWDLIGNCNDCAVRCQAKHPGSNPACNDSENIPGILPKMYYCRCDFVCQKALPAPKMCTFGYPWCTQECGKDCCSAKCGEKYQGGIGTCVRDVLFPGPLCTCTFLCP